MASALAHELNQPLTAIMNYLSAAELDLVGDEQRSTRGIVQKAAVQANRACEIIVRLRDFVQKKQTHHTEESVKKLIEETLAFVLVGSGGSNVKVQTDLTSDLPPVFADKIQVQQVLINLIRNGIEAMQDMPERELTLISTEGNRGYARVSVLDTGPGIQKEIADRLFQPFVTSKAKGLGVGLTISKTIIEAHGGRIWAVPNSRGGAAFHFELPFAENRPG
jgi:two-component system sensor kinase FixL